MNAVVPLFDATRTLPAFEADLLAAAQRVLRSNRLILGPETEAFESEFAAACGAAHALGVSSGTAALQASLMAIGLSPGAEVLTVANTCAPTAAAIRAAGCEPRFADVRPHDLMMNPAHLEAAITPQTEAVIVVHLWGKAAPMDEVLAVARKHRLAVIEDCAQAMGTRYGGKQVGTLGDVACFSFYPTKNLGTYGDAGAVITQNPALADRIRRLRMYGYDGQGIAQFDGLNARIAELQAAFLRIRLARFSQDVAQRTANANRYLTELCADGIALPRWDAKAQCSWHQFVLECENRTAVMARLNRQEVACGIHYPVPLHRMPAYADAGRHSLPLPITEQAAERILSIPVFEGLRAGEVRRVIDALNGS